MQIVNPPATLLVGPTGSGKTHSLLTFAKAGIETFIVSTESNGVESILTAAEEMKVDMNLVHWRQITPVNMDIQSMIASADKLSKSSVSDMQKVDSPAILQKSKYRRYIEFLENIANFKCDRTGQSYGDVTEWGPNRAFCVDSLSGLNMMVTQLQIGNRGTLTLPDYNVVQITLDNLLATLAALNCFSVVTAHIEMEKDEITGKVKVMASTVGRKLAPKLPIHFSEVVRSRYEGGKFLWSTSDDEADLKPRAFPRSDKIAPDFGYLVSAWKRKVEFAKKETPTA